jgi:flavin reductase (DIM6/NTAB) family NADH-FMN oxidoreductase RutF
MDMQRVDAVFAHRDNEVHIVSSQWDGHVTGLIAASVMRVAQDKLVASIRKEGLTHRYIESSKALAVTLLGEDQIGLLKQFAFFVGDGDEKFEGVPYETRMTGSPIIADSVGYLDCRVIDSMDCGDYTIFLAAILDGGLLRAREPLRAHHLAESVEVKAWREQWQARLTD